jgi:hypothetical protein
MRLSTSSSSASIAILPGRTEIRHTCNVLSASWKFTTLSTYIDWFRHHEPEKGGMKAPGKMQQPRRSVLRQAQATSFLTTIN